MITSTLLNSEFYNNSILLDNFTAPDDDIYLPEIVTSICETLYHQFDLPESGAVRISYYNHLEQLSYNLIVSIITSRPIAYSRDRNNYGASSRYDKLQFSYSFLIKLIDNLYSQGYINHIKGIFFTKNRKVSRFWPTQKFIDLVKNAKISMPVKIIDVEQIRLHAKKHHKNNKKLNGYNDNDHPDIIQMRNDVILINQTLRDANIELNIVDDIISINFLKRINDNSIYQNIINVNASDISIRIIRSVTTNMINNFNERSSFNHYAYDEYNISTKQENDYLQHAYNLLPIKRENNNNIIKSCSLDTVIDKLLIASIGKKCCEYYWANDLNITFNHKSYHRVFNENFDFGGRFFNAHLQQIPKHLRKYLTINGHKTIELDYSAQHLRMLYHKKGIDYRDDPYSALIDQPDVINNYIDDVLKITPDPAAIDHIIDSSGMLPNVSIFTKYRKFRNMSERTKYKIAQLILINAMDKFDKNNKEMSAKEVAIKAIMSELINGGLSNVNQKVVEKLIDKFEKIHNPIREYLYSGIALELQNLDSKIMNEILVTLAHEGVPALSYHDSVRVEEQYEALLRQLMMDVYKKHVGFYPVI